MKRAQEITGLYENKVMLLTIDTVIDTVKETGGAGLRLEVLIKPAIRAAAGKELPQDHAPFPFGLLPGNKDEYMITGGAFKGQRGFFTRDPSGAVTGVDLSGRLFSRIQQPQRL